MKRCLLILGVILAPWAVFAAVTPAQPPVDFIAVIQHAKEELFPKTVYIKTVLETYSEGKKVSEQATASGVIISSDGYVVTNFHVVNKAVSVRCILSERVQWEATTIGKDEDTDLALLKLNIPKDHPPLPYARFGDSGGLQAGDFVMAMGCPFGLARSVSFGVVSNPNQYVEGRSQYNNWIQTDASINPGNSGGPLADINGEVVGINTLEFSGTGLGFAIPSDIVRRIIEELKARAGWNGAGAASRSRP
jgi:serine protease Do